MLEAGPDYGALADRRWPPEMLDPTALQFSHDWGTGGEDARSLGARVLGGSSAHNACMVVQGTPADYDEWGPEWAYSVFAPHLDRARSELCTAPANTDRPAPFHRAFMLAAQEAGYPLLDRSTIPIGRSAWRPSRPTSADGVRWNAAFAYLDPARARANLTVEGGALVDRVVIERGKASGVILAGGRRIEAQLVVLAAGAYLTPAILVRSGIGPEPTSAGSVSPPRRCCRSASGCSITTAPAWVGSLRSAFAPIPPPTTAMGRCFSLTPS